MINTVTRVPEMSVLLRRLTILALSSVLFALAMTSAVQSSRREANRYEPLISCSAVSGYKCLSSL
jgi:hypothetical protein